MVAGKGLAAHSSSVHGKYVAQCIAVSFGNKKRIIV
eukprot:jgi/Antlo1/809/217